MPPRLYFQLVTSCRPVLVPYWPEPHELAWAGCADLVNGLHRLPYILAYKLTTFPQPKIHEEKVL